MYLGLDRWHPISSSGYWWKQIDFTEHFYRRRSSKALEWPEPHYHPSPGTNNYDIFFNVILFYEFPLHSSKFQSLPSLEQYFVFRCTDFFPPPHRQKYRKKRTMLCFGPCRLMMLQTKWMILWERQQRLMNRFVYSPLPELWGFAVCHIHMLV